MIKLFGMLTRLAKFCSHFLVSELITINSFKIDTSCVLIVRLDAIGDFILWSDAGQAIANYYKAQGKRVVLLANSAWASWAGELKIFDDVIPLVRREFDQNLIYRYRIGRKIRRLGCSTVVQPTYSREFLFGDAIVGMSGAREKLGSVGDYSNITGWQKRISDRWYTRLVPAESAQCMELIRNAEFVRGLTGSEFRARVPDLRDHSPTQSDVAFSAEVSKGESYYVLFPGASWAGKQWPLRRFGEIAEILHKKTGWLGVVCGGADDTSLGEELCRQTDVPLLNWTGCTNLSQLTSVISGAQLLLANDTSAAHIAAAVGVRTVCVLGGGHFGRFMPYEVETRDDRPLPVAVLHKMPCFGCNWRCIYDVPKTKPTPCIEEIMTAQVWSVIEQVIDS